MANCSDFKVFAEEKNRMCQSLEPETLCPLKDGIINWLCDECEGMCFQETDFAIRTVQKWSDEHPIKTRQSEFLKMFPNAPFLNGENVALNLCPKDLDSTFQCIAPNRSCLNCKCEYWMAEVE